jgi:uncharacterized protein YbjT (DUF2867 family)
MSNALWWRQSIRDSGTVVDTVGPGRLSSVDTDDVAAVAAVALIEDGHVGKAYTLTGPELLTVSEQVGILSRVLGRDIKYVDKTPDEKAREDLAAGQPEEAVEAERDLYQLFRDDRIAFLTDSVATVTGRAPYTFGYWCERHASEFD